MQYPFLNQITVTQTHVIHHSLPSRVVSFQVRGRMKEMKNEGTVLVNKDAGGPLVLNGCAWVVWVTMLHSGTI